MKFYRHYKNKPYKFIGIAKHSETLEDLVIYECRYDNPTAKIWVRPKEMFFENVNLDGKKVRRFAEVPISIETTTTVSEDKISIIASIIEKVLGEWDPKWLHSGLGNHDRYHLAIASIDNKPVGFKLGYEEDPSCFFSFLGAVLPEYGGLGIGTALMTSQHDWCQANGYHKIQTTTQNRFKETLMLNLKSGFEVIGTRPYEYQGGLKIVLEKILK